MENRNHDIVQHRPVLNSKKQAPVFDPPKRICLPQDGEIITCGNCNYYLQGMIGQGAFGTVYDCFDDWGNLLVAKVILPHNQSYDQVRYQWNHELYNLIQMRHPNITYVHNAFEYKSTFYIIVERCAGNLSPLILNPQNIPDLWLPHIARDVLHGLDFIHSRGMVHKDLHPGNVFVSHIFDRMVPSKDPVWTFKIGDLGISRLEENIRQFNTIMANWMLPPEYFKPMDFGIITRQVDIYHFGLLLLSMYLHKLPSFSQQEIVDGIPRQMAESLQSPYAPVIATALRRHVALRYQSAIDMWREIRSISISL